MPVNYRTRKTSLCQHKDRPNSRDPTPKLLQTCISKSNNKIHLQESDMILMIQLAWVGVIGSLLISNSNSTLTSNNSNRWLNRWVELLNLLD